MSTLVNTAGTVTYSYNALGQRVAKSGPTAMVPTGAAYYVYDQGGRLLGEYDANASPLYESIYLEDTPVGVVKLSGSAASSTLAATLYNVYADQINTPRVITRQNDEAIVWRWDSAEAFGASIPDQNPNALGTFTFNQRFPGQLFDAESGLSQNWNREYNARTGRYIQSDPIGLKGGINTYGYVGGQPLSEVDPRGLVTWSGTYHARAFIEGFGAGFVDMVLTSECIDGRRYRANVTGVGPGAGIGIPKVPLIASETYGKFSVNDQLSQMDPSVLAGGFAWASIGVSIGRRDASLGRVRVGRAFGNNPDHGQGLDVGATVIVGTSTVTGGQWEKCTCDER